MKNSKNLSNVKFPRVIIVFPGDLREEDAIHDLDIGLIRLEAERRQYIQDTTKFSWEFKNGKTTITCELEEDENELRELGKDQCNFELKESDLHNRLLKGSVFVAEHEEEPISMHLVVCFEGHESELHIDLDMD